MSAGTDVLTALAGFTRTLRGAGVPITPDRTAAFIEDLFARARNMPGQPQKIFWNETAGCYRCPNGHRIAPNGRPIL